MNDTSLIRLVGRILVLTSAGFAIALLAGTLISLLPKSPVEGFHSGIIVSGALAVLVYFIVVRSRGSRRLRSWLFDLHSVLGLATGILLGVIFLSGVLLLYRAEIEGFSNDWLEIEQGTNYLPVDDWLMAVGSRFELGSSKRIDITWPDSADRPVRIGVSGTNGSEQFYIDPYSARILDGEFSSKMGWVRRLHVGLSLGRPGHWLAGLVALIAIWLCITGLTMGRKVFSEWYIVRWRHGPQRFLSDVHKRIGLWLLPFIAINAFAGMLAALSSILTIGPIETRFGGNNGALYAAIGSPQSVERSEPFATPSMEVFRGIALEIMPDAEIRHMRILGYGDRNAIVGIRATRPGDLAPDGSSLIINIHASTGEILIRRTLAEAGFFERTSAALAAFHFAEYGGHPVRAIHAVTALAISALPIVGMAMWILRRRRRRALEVT